MPSCEELHLGFLILQWRINLEAKATMKTISELMADTKCKTANCWAIPRGFNYCVISKRLAVCKRGKPADKRYRKPIKALYKVFP